MTEERRSEAAVLVHLSGPLRGTIHVLRETSLLAGTAPEAEIGFPEDDAPTVRPRHARLDPSDEGHVVRAEEGADLRVNGSGVERHTLRTGDLVQLGEGGPLLRYRVHRGEPAPYKSIGEAFRDCVDCARHGSDSHWRRAWLFLDAMPRELLTQTAPWARAAVVVVVAVLITATALLALRSWHLERRLDAESDRLATATRLLEESRRNQIGSEELQRIRSGLAADLVERVAALEERREAVPAVIATASRSIAFIQGAYGFLDPDSGRPLRTIEGADGEPIADRQGRPIVTPDADGPVLEMRFTGTAFVVDTTGLMLTNRHVARPWEYDAAARAATERGFAPNMRRMLGYLPGIDEPFEVRLAAVSESADLALLRAPRLPQGAQPLALETSPARPGDEAVVLGYPTGIRALLARTSPGFVDTLMQEGSVDFWAVARRLSEGGHIAPLASRGIIGQVTDTYVVYDAETTRGGSGGPVLSLDGEVLGVTVGVLPEFGGSNLGVPAAEARRLLERFQAGEGQESQGGG